MISFSKEIKRELFEKGMNATEFADAIGVSPQYVWNLLQGNRRWNEEIMVKACTVLGLEMKIVHAAEAADAKAGVTP